MQEASVTHATRKAQALAAEQALARMLRESQEGASGLLPVLADKSSDAIFVVDNDRNIVLFNPRAEEITGFSRDEVLGQHCLAGFRCTRCLEACRVFKRESIDDVEVDLYRKDGGLVRVRKTAAVVRDRAGHPLGAVEIFRAVSDESTDGGVTEDPRSAQWRTVGSVMAALGRGMVLLGHDFRVNRISDTLAELLDRPVETLEGRDASELLGEELFAPASAFRAALARGERREGWRAVITRPSGTQVRLSVTGTPAPEGGPCEAGGGGYLVVVRSEETPAGLETASSGPVVFESMVARSPQMRRVFSLIDHLRDSDATVLVTGESGTGKELVAKAIHSRSTRAKEPFVVVNCGALPADLLESELFGHVRGAFTGAVRDKAGRAEVAGEGTLFLDEIGDLPLPLQVKLLRLLQERTFERVGETQVRRFRARVISATHQDLATLTEQKRFREDLYYRLNVVPIVLSPLRERREDIDLLITHLLDKIGRRRARAQRLSPAAMRALLAYDWPGNVRQLENALEYATAVCDGQTIHAEDLPSELYRSRESQRQDLASPGGDNVQPGDRRQSGKEPDLPLGAYPSAEQILRALDQTRHRRTAAAELLGVSRTTLWRRMKQLGLAGR